MIKLVTNNVLIKSVVTISAAEVVEDARQDINALTINASRILSAGMANVTRVLKTVIPAQPTAGLV